jgi:AcrR family transcriptional regulator
LSSQVSVPPAPRADAVRNRARLVDAAKRVFASDGDFGPEAVARAAGVGIGTLYRHFPDRNDLAAAVYEDELGSVADSARDLLKTQRPADALRQWMDRFEQRFEHKRSMAPALQSLIGSGTVSSVSSRARLAAAVQEILDAGIATGELRAETRGADVVVALAAVCIACAAPESHEQLERLLDLLVAGIRT